MELTVVIPTYNTSDYAKLAIESVLESGIPKENIVVVVDGSQDNVQQLADLVPQVYVFPKNMGQTYAWNYGAERAKTKYVVLLNDDMVVSPDWWKHPLNLLEDYPNSIVSSQLIEPGTKLRPINAIVHNCGDSCDNFDKRKFLQFVEENRKYNTLDKMNLPMFLTKKDYMVVGGWDHRFASGPLSDWDFRTKLSLLGREAMCSQDSLVYHFSGKATRFANNSEQQTEKFINDENHNRNIYYQKWGFFGTDEVYKIPIGREVNGIKYPNPRKD